MGCPTPEQKAREALTYPMTQKLEVVVINEHPEWSVAIAEKERPGDLKKLLKPGERRSDHFEYEFSRPFEIRQLYFSAEFNGRPVATQMVQVRPGDPQKAGLVFDVDAEHQPTLYRLTNP